MRIGHGYDVHRLVENRDLILGGVKIPYHLGLDGHSDADVLVHAIMDALLGAAAMGDIGKHFPDTDPAYKGADSLKLLEHVGRLLDENLYVIATGDIFPSSMLKDAVGDTAKINITRYYKTPVSNIPEAEIPPSDSLFYYH